MPTYIMKVRPGKELEVEDVIVRSGDRYGIYKFRRLRGFVVVKSPGPRTLERFLRDERILRTGFSTGMGKLSPGGGRRFQGIVIPWKSTITGKVAFIHRLKGHDIKKTEERSPVEFKVGDIVMISGGNMLIGEQAEVQAVKSKSLVIKLLNPNLPLVPRLEIARELVEKV